MNAQITPEAVAGLPSLAAYAMSDLKILLSASRGRELPSGEVLCREGDPGRSCVLVVSGALDVTKHGVAEVLATLREGTFVGQMALVDHAPRSATVTASWPTATTVLLEFDRDTFERLLSARSPLALQFQAQIAVAGIRQLRQATARLVDVAGGDSVKTSSTKAPASRTPASHGRDDVLRYIQAAANEWDLDLNAIHFVHGEGEVSAAEAAARRRATGPGKR